MPNYRTYINAILFSGTVYKFSRSLTETYQEKIECNVPRD